MDRKIPVWVLLLTVLVGALLAVGFGWTVKSSLRGSDHPGRLGHWAVAIAGSPDYVSRVFSVLAAHATGDYRDQEIRVPREQEDLSGFRPVPAEAGVDLDGLMVRADPETLTPGWRLMVGAFVIDGAVENAAVMLSPSLEAVNVRRLTEVPVGGHKPRRKYRKFVHGLAILDDASLVFTFDGSISLQRIDRCGKLLWSIPGPHFHHAVTATEDGTAVWSLHGNDQLVQVAVSDGTVLRRISLHEVIRANPQIDILELRRFHDITLGANARGAPGRWMEDPFHMNDIEPLPAALAGRFEAFDAGDLLLSLRSLNLVFVLDPDTLAIKWWRIGATQRQHDPDWQPDGTITVLNNRMSEDASEILAFDPESFDKHVLFDGRANDFYTRIRGKHQVTPTGHIVVTSTQQGRAFEVDASGDVTLEVINTKPGSKTDNYVISEMKWLPPGAFDRKELTCPS